MEESKQQIIKRYIDFLISKGDLKFGWNENITEYISLEYLEQSNMAKIMYLDDNKLYDKYVEIPKSILKESIPQKLVNKIMAISEYLHRKKVYGRNPNPVMKDIQVYVDLDKNKAEDNDTMKNTL